MAKKNKSDKTVNHYKIILYNETTLHEVTSFTITRLNILAVTGLIFVIIALMVSVLFIYTPLNAFLPSYTDSKLRKELVESAIRTDSIYKVLQNREEYFAKIRCIMEGEDFETYKETHDTVTPERQKVDFTKSKHDSILRTLIEEEEQQNLALVNGGAAKEKIKNLTFFMPIKGPVTKKFDAKTGHLGVDIVSKDDEPVLATLAGTVTLATWSLETGNVIQIQHDDNIISIYKHNSTLLKKVGDKVKAGEPIAIIGNSGELTSGTHLHFEIWHNGVPVNPEDYIAY